MMMDMVEVSISGVVVGGGSSSEVVLYSPKRAGVRLGVMGASSFLPGVQIFTALNQKMAEMYYETATM